VDQSTDEWIGDRRGDFGRVNWRSCAKSLSNFLSGKKAVQSHLPLSRREQNELLYLEGILKPKKIQIELKPNQLELNYERNLTSAEVFFGMSEGQ